MTRNLTLRQQATVDEWLRRNPTNAPMRPHEVFPAADRADWRHLERCRRLIRDRVLVSTDATIPERERRYIISAQYLPPITG